MSSENIESLIGGCLARGYTHSSNTNKEVDVVLIESMTQEVMRMLRKPLPETVILTFETFASDKTTADLLEAIIVRDGKRKRR